MGIAASLLFYTAAVTQTGGQEVQAHATTQIVAGAQVRFGQEVQTVRVSSKVQPQIKRDNAQIMWIEFS